MAQTLQSAPLTLENLQAYSSPFTSQYPSTPSTVASEEDSVSLFSYSAVSSASSAPEDEEAPFTVQASTGESITVYQTMEQAVRYSLLRAEQERRQEDESRRFAYAPLASSGSFPASQPASASTSWATSLEAPHGEVPMEEDEDAYFSMG